MGLWCSGGFLGLGLRVCMVLRRLASSASSSRAFDVYIGVRISGLGFWSLLDNRALGVHGCSCSRARWDLEFRFRTAGEVL